jgi:hypothetical protein
MRMPRALHRRLLHGSAASLCGSRRSRASSQFSKFARTQPACRWASGRSSSSPWRSLRRSCGCRQAPCGGASGSGLLADLSACPSDRCPRDVDNGSLSGDAPGLAPAWQEPGGSLRHVSWPAANSATCQRESEESSQKQARTATGCVTWSRRQRSCECSRSGRPPAQRDGPVVISASVLTTSYGTA